MATTFTWSITRMECLPQTPEGPDYVVNASWQCVGSDAGFTAINFGAANFPVVQSESFTPYDQLTQAQVLGWCWDNGTNKAETEAITDMQLQNQINPPVITPPLPWG